VTKYVIFDKNKKKGATRQSLNTLSFRYPMTKIKTSISNQKGLSIEGTNLDTLVQLRTDTDNQIVTKAKNQLLSLQKKARSKAISNAITFKLVDVKPKLYEGQSVMNKTYWRAYHCNNVLIQEGKKLTARYCNTRHCLVCNRIRSAKAIKGYTPSIMKLDKNLWFVTLTVKSVDAGLLRLRINDMTKGFRRVQKNLKNTHKIKLKGIRKLEVNYNPTKDTFNPHFHLIVSGNPCEVILLKSLWLNQFSTIDASVKSQDIRPTNEGATLELFKYFTKVLTKGNLYPVAMDVIFTAMKGKRTVQPFGGLKIVSEDIDEIQSDEMEFLEVETNKQHIFSDDYLDWVSEYGEVLSNHKPTSETLDLIASISK
jgi:hypothetical protein